MDQKDFPPNAVIIDVRPTDFIAGGETRIGAQPILSSDSQYDHVLPDEETQYELHFDTFACVTFSALNLVESILSIKIANGSISQKNVQWLKDNGYVDYRTGKVNVSDRFTAKMSKTSKNGNSLGAVGDSVRNHGLVPESVWPFPGAITEEMPYEEKWNTYYAEIPQSVKDLGLEFQKRFDVAYQWIIVGVTDQKVQEQLIKKWLPYGPIQIASMVCTPWNSTDANPPIKGCGCGTQHATMIYGYTDGESYKDFDHYRSFRKLLAWDYCIPYATQYYITENMERPIPPEVNLAFGAEDSKSVRALQACLQDLLDRNGSPYMKKGVFGPYGPQTRTALGRFQTDNGIVDSPQGQHYGPKTRAALKLKLG